MEMPLPMGLRFSILHRAFRRQMDEYVRESGLTGVQFSVLGALDRLERMGGEVTQKALEEAMHATHPTMTELLKKLEAKGFVTCCTSENDRRCKVVSSADKARELHQLIDGLDARAFTQLSRGLSEDDIAALTRITNVMLENVLENVEELYGARGIIPCGKECESV